MFVLESSIRGGETTKKKFEFEVSAFVAMKSDFMEVARMNELQVATILSVEDSEPGCEFTTYTASDRDSRSFWKIYREDD